MFFYNHSLFQSEARICLNFSQSQPQNMHISEHSKGQILPTPEGNELVKGLSCDNEIVPMWCTIYIWCDKDAANMHKQYKSYGD